MQAVAPMAALSEGETLACRAARRDIVICQVAGRTYAVGGVCPHAGSSLANAGLDGFELVCPRHGARFDVRSGACTNGTTTAALTTYPVVLERGKVHV